MTTPDTGTTAADTTAAMRRALELAARGPALGANPQVGCVLMDATGAIVAEGWHRGAGTPHAEVDALANLASHRPTNTDADATAAAPIARGLTAVVTLEPCNHTGRTGPCSEALIAAGVSRVVYALSDPFPGHGGGAERLREAGVAVEIAGIAEAEAFLRVWLTSVRHGRPYVTVKWASSLDGRAAAADGTSQWITGTAARQRVHEQRAANDAILVGTGTLLADDPSLTARGDAGELLAQQPVPVVIGERGVPATALVRSHPAGLIETGTRDLDAVLADLFARGIRRAYVEGGPTLASALVERGLVDEFAIYLAPTIIGGPRTAITDAGVATITDQHRLTITSIEPLGDDVLITAHPQRSN